MATAWILAIKDKLVRSGEIVPNINSERLRKLNPILCDGIMLLGGRLARAPVSESVRHPVILPLDHHVTELLVGRVLKGTEGDKRSAWIRTKKRTETLCVLLRSCVCWSRTKFGCKG